MTNQKKIGPPNWTESASSETKKNAIPPPALSQKETVQKLETLEEMIRSINDKIQKAEVLNGGFNELKLNVTDIRHAQIKMELEIKSIRAQESQLKEKIEEINEAVYDPDNGIYRRINESMTLDKIRDEKIDGVIAKIAKVENILKPIEKTEEDLKKIAGNDLKELQSIVKTRQVIDRMFWIMLTALVGGAAKILWDLVASAYH
jgi:TolA-binding protein